MSDVPMTRQDEMLAIHYTKHISSATFVELDDGRILHAADQSFITSDDGGLTWSEEFRCRDTNGGPVGGKGTSLVKLDGKGIGLAAIRRHSQGDLRIPEVYTLFWRSVDGGETWEPPVRATPEGVVGNILHDVLLRTSSGRIVLPAYLSIGQPQGPNELRPPGAAPDAVQAGRLINGQWVSTAAHFFDPGFEAAYVMYSDDEGRTWQRNKDGELFILLDWNASYSYVNEPTVAEVSPGKLLMFMRTGLGRLFQAWSYDNGETWTRPQPTSLAASTTPCQIRTLPNGHVLVVWNQEGEQDVKRGYNRQRISSAISRNGGSIWEYFQNIESLHEGTRVEPGPIRPVRPAEYYFEPGMPAPERDVEHILPDTHYARFAYPSVFVIKDRVLVGYGFVTLEEHPTRAQLIRSTRDESAHRSKIKVLPLTWFYGGKEPADSLELPRAAEEPPSA